MCTQDLSATLRLHGGSNLTGTSYTWNLSPLPPGSSYRVKVIATDGFYTGQDQSDASFTVTGQVYLPLIAR